MYRLVLKMFPAAIFVAVLFAGSIWVAGYVAENDLAQDLVEQFGYLGVFLLAIIGGFNLVVPFPAAALSPIFLSTDLSVVGIIFTLALGTTLADSISYAVGILGRKHWEIEEHPYFLKFKTFRDKHEKWTIPILLLYASFVPYPNEILTLPLGFLGVRFRTLMPALLLGNLLHNTLLIVGITSLLSLLS